MIRKFFCHLNAFLKKSRENKCDAFAAQAAFFIILSFIPFIILLSSLIQYTPVTQESLISGISKVFPDIIQPVVTSVINEIYTKSHGVIPITIIASIWSSAKGVQYISNGLNAVYEIEETRSWLFLRIRAVFYTILFLLVIIISFILLIFGNHIQYLLSQHLPFVSEITKSIISLRAVIAILVYVTFFNMVYKILPNRNVTFLSQFPGALIAAVAWSGFSFCLSVYVDYFNGLSMYGSLMTIVLVMLWLYVCMYIILICAQINKYFEKSFSKVYFRSKIRKNKIK